MMDTKRITLFAGHYGSGKTNIAINYALLLRKSFERVSIADLDIVNPYFRTKDSEKVLEENAVSLISSKYAGTNVDFPALPAEAYAITDDTDIRAVIDVGGDDRGALALGRYTEKIIAEGNYEMLFVVNKYRPLTRDAESAAQIKEEIENACSLPFTAIVNNSNIGGETTRESVLSSLGYAREVSRLTGLPVKMMSVRHDLAKELKDEIENLFPIHLYVKQSWQRD